MSKEDFIKTLENKRPQSLEKDYDGHCPCSSVELEIDGFKFGYRSRCWRVSENSQDLIIWGNHPDKVELAELVKKKLDEQEWYNPYTIIYE